MCRQARRTDVSDALALVTDAPAAEQIRFALAADSVRAAVTVQDGKVLGCCLYDAMGKGTVGPLYVEPGAEDIVRPQLLRSACRAMLRAGYWYALAEGPGLADCPALVPDAAVPVPVVPAPQPSERDVPGPWADLYLPLGEELEQEAADHVQAGRRTVHILRPLASHRIPLIRWVAEEFGEGWASEVEAAFERQPVSVLFATDNGRLDQSQALLGFTAWGVSALGMTGPTALRPSARGTQLAMVLTDRCLRELRRDGYPYAILGGFGKRRGALRELPSAWAIPGSYPALFPRDPQEVAGVDD
ncbi:hypothetical protein [Streptomyces sp. NPDC096013]|uniref:hypothetical protein n=1 Tax=Streptomyces sp. NPDC096013 TaxID=3366069 RepID=UPI00380BABBB